MSEDAGARPRPTQFELPLSLFKLPREGRAYDLSSGWWPGMPLGHGHPPFQVLTYRSPAGERNQRDLPFLENNSVNFGFVSELMMGTSHTGTHIDALAHITCGPQSAWHGGNAASEHLGDFGPLNKDASELPPLIKRGLLLDVPAALGVERLAAHQPIDRVHLQAACARQEIEIRRGDFVLIRTGTMLEWPSPAGLAASSGSGLSLDGARWLADLEVAAIGGDNAALEVDPSGIEGDPQPVHRFLIHELGLFILEWVNPEELARDRISEFLFICLPLSIRGATGSMVRPLAIV